MTLRQSCPSRATARAALPLILLAACIAQAAPPRATSGEPPARVGRERIETTTLDAAAHAQLAAEDANHAQALRRLTREHARSREALLQQTLDDLVDRRVMELEAQARGTRPFELLKDVATPTVDDASVAEFHAANAAQIGRPLAEAAEPIRQMLVGQALDRATRRYLDALRDKWDAHVLREPHREVVAPIGPASGPADAPVTLVEFADFQCPYCARMHYFVRQLAREYPRELRIVVRQLPLVALHPDARRAAHAALCANDQQRFWELHDWMYRHQDALDAASLAAAARAAGLDGAAFDACLADERHAPAIAADVAAADALGIDGTPAFYVNGRELHGAVPLDQLARLIDDELRRARRATTPARR